MTIISVVYVPEGIAMASDSRLTRKKELANGEFERYIFSDNAQKLVLIKNSSIGVSYCGDAIIEGKTVADFLRKFDIEEVEDSDSVTLVAEKLKLYLSKYYQSYNVLFYLAGFDNDEPFVYLINQENLIRKNYFEGELEYGASWSGDYDPVSRLFNENNHNFHLMPLKDAIDMSEFIVGVAINYFRFTDGISTCGGPIDSLVITKDYTKFIKHKILKP